MARDQVERYRQAAGDALGQLDWCIGYLQGIKKGHISAQLAKNRSYIRREVLKKAPEPLPSETTSES